MGSMAEDDDDEMMQNLQAQVKVARDMYKSGSYSGCIDVLQACLCEAASCNNENMLSELHLLLAKCYRGQDDLKNAIQSCNSAIQHRPLWKDPFLYRSACFQAWHQYLSETDGDLPENILKDQFEADIIVSQSGCHGLRSGQVVATEIDHALKLAKDGAKIFVLPGQYSAQSLFLCSKSVSLIGASSKRSVLVYTKKPGRTPDEQLETFLICSMGTTYIKRLTFRNLCQRHVKTKFLGVAGGTVQLEDCLFDGTGNPQVDGVYTSVKILGDMADTYPPPHVLLRFCVFDTCQLHGAFTAFHSRGSLSCCLFVASGRSAIVAMDSSKVSVEHCEMAQTGKCEQTISVSQSMLDVIGTYVHNSSSSEGDLEFASSAVGSQAIALTLKAVARLAFNYIYKSGTGIHCQDSDMVASHNMIMSCSQGTTALPYSSRRLQQPGADLEQLEPQVLSNIRMCCGLAIREQSKVQVKNNIIKMCDVGIYVGGGACPTIKSNTLYSSLFAGTFVEGGQSRPSIVNNTYLGEQSGDHSSIRAIGILLVSQSAGLIGKNVLDDYRVAPIMVFSSCHPLVKDNKFKNIELDDESQKQIEKSMLEQFHAELFKKDEYFYIVDSDENEKALQDVILKNANNKKPADQ